MSREVTILVVDDDRDLCEAISDVVELKSGYSAELAGTAREALDIARRKTVAVALLDLTLPDMDGLDLLREMKQVDSATAFIILSGHTSVEREVEAASAGAVSYLVKPSSPAELMEAIEEALERRGGPPPSG